MPLTPEVKEQRKIERDSWKLARYSFWAGRLRELLARKGMTPKAGQKWLVIATGEDRSTVNRWFNGKRKPTEPQSVKIAAAFGVPVVELDPDSGRTWKDSPAVVNSVPSGTSSPEGHGMDMAQVERVTKTIDVFLATKSPVKLTDEERQQMLTWAFSTKVDLSDPLLESLARGSKIGFAFNSTS